MHSVSFEYAQAHLAELLVEIAGGEEIVIERDSRPLGRLVAERSPVAVASGTEVQSAEKGWPVLGMLKGKVWMAPDFDAIPEGFEEYLQ